MDEEPIEELRELEKLIGTEATEKFARETVDEFFPCEASDAEKQEIVRLCREGKVEAKEPAALDAMLEVISAGQEPEVR